MPNGSHYTPKNQFEQLVVDKFELDPGVLVNQFGKEFKGRTLEEINTLDGAYWLSLLDSRIKREEQKAIKREEQRAAK